jgi:hypothetical protein
VTRRPQGLPSNELSKLDAGYEVVVVVVVVVEGSLTFVGAVVLVVVVAAVPVLPWSWSPRRPCSP